MSSRSKRSVPSCASGAGRLSGTRARLRDGRIGGPQPKPPWRQRKMDYLAHLTRAPDEVLLISACHKLHNARSIVEEHPTAGPAFWNRFTGRRDGTLWYYQELGRVLTARGPARLAALLCETVARMVTLA